ncbi:MAG: hypothetical protein K1Y36_12660 [Blastocatellia bacterium]|nr:hypothetical protein [Blastocatellia bacterium]
MNHFFLDGTDFGIDTEKSSVRLGTGAAEMAGLDIEIYGDERLAEEAGEDEAGKWSWILYPPHLYLLGCQIFLNPQRAVAEAQWDEPDNDETEAGLYLLEHFDLRAVSLRLLDRSRLEISGQVRLEDRWCDFSVVWDEPVFRSP